jgi:hypothetical protein
MIIGILITILIIAAVVIFLFPDLKCLMRRLGFLSRISGLRSKISNLWLKKSKYLSLLKDFMRHLNIMPRILNYKSKVKTQGLASLLTKTGLVNTKKKEPDLNSLNCRIQSAICKEGNNAFNAFSVEICGSIHAPSDGFRAGIKISILDITEGIKKTKPVRPKGAQTKNDEFCYNADLGRFPNKVTILSGWTNVAKLRMDSILLPRSGRRILQFNVSILSAESKEILAESQYIYEHENVYFGYIDLQENIERSKTLAVALAFAVNAADGGLNDSEVNFIKNWARENINTAPSNGSASLLENSRTKLEKALDETVTYFRDGNLLNTNDICAEIADIVPIAQRYDILELCLNALKASGSVDSEELGLLKYIVKWMEVDNEKFRSMLEKYIPLSMLDTKDYEAVLGVTSDMTGETVRTHLNREYAKWNSRVTNSDPNIQSQADQMLKLIAEARSQYTR